MAAVQPGPSRPTVVPQSPDGSMLSDDSDISDDSEGDEDDSEYDFSGEDAQEICTSWLLEQSQETV